jgi:hypothetical protein
MSYKDSSISKQEISESYEQVRLSHAHLGCLSVLCGLSLYEGSCTYLGCLCLEVVIREGMSELSVK